MTTIKYVNQPKIYLNELVKDAASFFPDKVESVEVEVVDAFFTRVDPETHNSEELFLIEGIHEYFSSSKYLKTDSPEEMFLFKKYSGISLTLRVREPHSGIHAFLRLNDKDEIASQLDEIVMENKEIENQRADEQAKKKANPDYEENMIYLKNVDSSSALIGRYLVAYRQTVNGHEISGFSKKYYAPINIAETGAQQTKHKKHRH